MSDNLLRYAHDYADPDNPLTAGTPTWADAADWHAQNLARNWQAMHDPQTWIDAAHQYGNALIMGSISPRVFHGTSQPGLIFDPNRPAYFSTDPAHANFYAETGAPKFVGDPAQPNVIPAYLDLKNPKVIEGLTPSEHAEAFEAARRAGHDGVILRSKGLPDTYVAFNPSQVRPGIGAAPSAEANGQVVQ